MRRSLVLRLALACLALLPAAAAAQPPKLEIGVPLTLTGTPLRVDVSPAIVEGDELTVLLDGRELPPPKLEADGARLVFEKQVLASGDYRVEVQSRAGTAEAAFRVGVPGWLSILPPLLAIGLALLTRDVLVSLFLGIFGGSMILFSWNPFAAFGHALDVFVVGALADSDHASIIIFTTLLGGMVGLITKSGGTHGIVEMLTPFATNRRRGLLATWAMGLVVFFDDYANTLIVGPTMRPITDRLRISREKLAYIVDSTAAPVVCLVPISTWVGFELGLIGDAFDQLGLPYDPYSAFLATIPYRFYPIFALLLVLTLVLTRTDFGPMRQAEDRARNEGKVLADGAKPIADYASDEVEPAPDVPKRAWNALIPIATVVVVTVIGLYLSGAPEAPRGAGQSWIEWSRDVLAAASSYKALLWASLCGTVVALVLPLSQRILDLREGMAAMMAGCKAMLMALVVLVLAWSLSGVCSELQTAAYTVGLTREALSPAWLPALTFVLSAAIAFATGSSWGTMAILEPLVIPICHSLATAAGLEVGGADYGSLMFATIGSVLAGSIWGDHCSPISDTTILSSMASGCDHIAHVRTQLPYALTGGALAILIGNVLGAFGWSPWLSLLLGAVLIVGGVTLIKRRQVLA